MKRFSQHLTACCSFNGRPAVFWLSLWLEFTLNREGKEKKKSTQKTQSTTKKPTQAEEQDLTSKFLNLKLRMLATRSPHTYLPQATASLLSSTPNTATAYSTSSPWPSCVFHARLQIGYLATAVAKKRGPLLTLPRSASSVVFWWGVFCLFFFTLSALWWSFAGQVALKMFVHSISNELTQCP